MTAWSALTVLQTILTNYYFGSAVAYDVAVIVGFLIAFMIAGLEFRYAAVLVLPLVGAFALQGVFGAYAWVGNVALLLVGIVYAYAVLDLFT